MFRRFLSGIENQKDNEEESHLDDDDHEHTEEEENDEKEDEDNVEALLIPSDQEKKGILASFDAMRKDSLFCDVAFVSQGVLFRCHRVVVSSWSRWMRTFLCDSPEEEILSLDIFAPDAFGAVLDYMYGYPLQVTEQRADVILKVVRRLEMHKLEQQIWRYLITILNERNCDLLHELADRYDCPPLKLAAWRLLKEKIPGLGNFPTKRVLMEAARARSHVLNGTGLIGPGDALFNTLAVHHPKNDRRNAGLGNMPSVFEDDDDEDEEDEDEEDDERQDRRRQKQNMIALEDLAADADATTVIQAWSQRLKSVYTSCAAEADAVDEENLSQLRLDESTPNVKLTRVPRPPVPPPSAAIQPAPVLAQPSNPLSSTGPNISRPPNASPANKSKPTANAALVQKSGMEPTEVRTKMTKGVKTIDWETELTDFYDAVGAPQKIPGIPAILKAWEGKEERMIQNLMKKYEGNIPKKTLSQLERIYSFLETQTEVSIQVSPVRAGRR